MLTFKFIIIVISLLNQSNIDALALKCSQWTEITAENRPVFLIVDIGVLNANWSVENFKQTIAELRMANFVLSTQFMNGSLQIKSPSALPRYVFYKNKRLPLSFVDSELKSSPCMKRLGEIGRYQLFHRSNESRSSGLVLHVCRINQADIVKIYRLKKEIMLMTDGETKMTLPDVQKYLNADVNMIGMEVNGFEERGFCLCDEFERILNECIGHDDEEDDEMFGKNTLILIFIGLYAVVVIASVTLYVFLNDA
jgi:hypothetical protein